MAELGGQIMKTSTWLLAITFLCHLLLADISIATAQASKISLPMIAGAAVPLYPPLARAAHIEGIVHVRITTDGHRVIDAHVEDGNKLLAAAAEENVRTWQFATHQQTTFIVTYRYKLDAGLKGSPNNPTVTLRLPTEVEVSTTPLVINDPQADVK
jgi:hypothetical protein